MKITEMSGNDVGSSHPAFSPEEHRQNGLYQNLGLLNWQHHLGSSQMLMAPPTLVNLINMDQGSQALHSTISILHNTLTLEHSRHKTEEKRLKDTLVFFMSTNKSLESQLGERQKQIEALQNELEASSQHPDSAATCVEQYLRFQLRSQQKAVGELKAFNKDLENKNAEMAQQIESIRHLETHELDTLRREIEALKASNSTWETKYLELSHKVDSEVFTPDRKQEDELAARRDECDELKRKLDEVSSAKTAIADKFKELSMQYLSVGAYNGKKYYDDLLQKCKTFIGELRRKGELAENADQRNLFEQTLERVEAQVVLIEQSRTEFQAKFAIMMDRIKLGINSVSDLKLGLCEPALELHPDSFQGILSILSSMVSNRTNES